MWNDDVQVNVHTSSFRKILASVVRIATRVEFASKALPTTVSQI